LIKVRTLLVHLFIRHLGEGIAGSEALVKPEPVRPQSAPNLFVSVSHQLNILRHSQHNVSSYVLYTASDHFN